MANNLAFNTISSNRLKRAAHDLSHSRKFTMNMGELVPILCQDVIPGDSFQLKHEALVRIMPMLAPIYHNVNVYMHYFFVPYRLVWNEWEDFITGGRDGNANPVFPRFYQPTPLIWNGANKLGVGSLADYLGFPSKQIPSSAISFNESKAFSQLPFRAYHTIYNEYYRDQNLEDEVPISKDSGLTEIFTSNDDAWDNQFKTMRKRAWEKDYFTSALPNTQRGTPMSIPVQGDAAVYADNNGQKRYLEIGDGFLANTSPNLGIKGTDLMPITGNEIFADLTNVSTATINELRQAFQIQRWLERSARSGARYTEVLQSFFGVRPRDSRLQRPEFLGGGKMPLSISEVLQTSETSNTPLGEFAGHGITYGSTVKFRKFFEEHGIIIGIMSVLPRTAYCQGMPKLFTKFDKYDYFWQEFAHLGEQEIKNEELYFDPVGADNKDTFGYTARYNEYRYIPDTVHGNMLDSLSYWHMARMFPSRPALNADFIKADPTNRIFPVQDATHKLIIQTHAQLKAIRPVPKYGDPLGI